VVPTFAVNLICTVAPIWVTRRLPLGEVEHWCNERLIAGRFGCRLSTTIPRGSAARRGDAAWWRDDHWEHVASDTEASAQLASSGGGRLAETAAAECNIEPCLSFLTSLEARVLREFVRRCVLVAVHDCNCTQLRGVVTRTAPNKQRKGATWSTKSAAGSMLLIRGERRTDAQQEWPPSDASSLPYRHCKRGKDSRELVSRRHERLIDGTESARNGVIC